MQEERATSLTKLDDLINVSTERGRDFQTILFHY